MNLDEDRDSIISMLESPEMNPQRFKSFISKHMNEALNPIGITESQAIFIKVLNDKEGQSLREITDKVGMDKSLTTRMIRSLIDKGWIENISEVGNEYSIILTEEGLKAQKLAHDTFRELLQEIMKELDDNELAVLCSIMSKLTCAASKLSEERE